MAVLAAPGVASAALQTFGSDLSARAALDTTYLQPGGHNGSDTFMWNAALANGSDPRSPADGQVTDIKLKGCTNATLGAPRATPGFDTTAIEFQDLAPQPDGSFATASGRTATGNAAGQHFELPLCTTAGGAATQDTVTDYKPVNLCTNAGHYVELADNGGQDPRQYPNGIPYQVFGRVPGSVANSYIIYPGGPHGVFKPGDQMSGGGFYVNQDFELLLQATVGTGADGTGLCAGGGFTGGGSTGGGGGGRTASGSGGAAAEVVLHPQADGVNRKGIVKVAIFCAQPAGCTGIASLATGGKASAAAKLASHSFNIKGKNTSKVSLKLKRSGIALIRKHHRKLAATLSVSAGGKTAIQAITLKL